MKKIILIFLALTLTFALFACGNDSACTNHTDADKDGKCDTCAAVVETENNDTNSDIELIKNGAVNFQIVKANNLGSTIMIEINNLKTQLSSLGATLNIVEDKADTAETIEVLVGDVTTRGEEYTMDRFSLGEKGYVIKKIGNKIIINGGSDASTASAVSKFAKEILGIKSSTKSLSDAAMNNSQSITEIQSGYRITSIKVNGVDLKGYTIAYDKNVFEHSEAAKELHDYLYTKTGYYLPLVDISEAGKSIIISAVKDAGKDGFRVKTTEDGALTIECAYANKFDVGFAAFLNNELRLKEGDIDFNSSYQFTEEISVVYYDDFMHLSKDGNDYYALKAAHDFANQCGQTVKATRNKTYTIKDIVDENGKAAPIIIKTNVEWTNAKIVIDDREMHLKNNNSGHVFIVKSDYDSDEWTAEEIANVFPNGVDADTVTKIEWNNNYPALLAIFNDEHKNYIRYGGDANNGAVQKELIIIDENGNIDSSANFMLDYEKVTRVTAYRTDDNPITIQGGTITTISSRYCPKNSNGEFTSIYYRRGIEVKRSNTTLKNIKHYVTNEVENAPSDTANKGPSYYGFFTASYASNVYFTGLLFTARRYYKLCGTYDFTSEMVNNIYLKDCKQSNFYLLDEDGNPTETLSMTNSMYWGVGGTNYCKNMVYDGCELTRYDAHSGVHNGKIINSKITMAALIGAGEMLIENTTIEPTAKDIVTLRSDYGSTWAGTVTLRNCHIVNKYADMNLFSMTWVNHDFGYTVHMPNIVIDGLTFENTVNSIAIFKEGASNGYFTMTTEQFIGQPVLSNGNKNVNIVVAPSFITLLNPKGYVYTLRDSVFYNDTKVSDNILITYG